MKTDHAYGAMLGLAIGDALGAPVEFFQRGRFEPITTMRAGGKFKMQLGEWTDDTAMALCLADSLLSCNGFDAADQMERYWRWGNEGYNSTRNHAFGVGKTVSQALMQYRRTGNPFAGSESERSAGNGSIMRLAPVVLYYLNDYQQLLHFAELSSRTTHQASEALFCCKLLAHCIYKAITENCTRKSMFTDFNVAPPTERCAELRSGSYRSKSSEQISSSGYVVECLEAALWAFESTDSFEEALLMAVNLGEDSDTVGAVCGQIAGAFYGLETIPVFWLEVLHSQEHLKAVAKRLVTSGRSTRTNSTSG